jgi:hypothetical protein
MKKLVLIFAILFSSFYELIAQNLDTKFLIEEYIKQSEKQKKTAIIMMGVGAGATALGFLLVYSAKSLDSPGTGSGFRSSWCSPSRRIGICNNWNTNFSQFCV